MPQNITDVDQFDDPVEAPADGDPLDSASIITTSIQKLANRTRNLANRIGGAVGADEWTFEDDPRNRRIMIGSRHGNGEPGWTYNLIDRATCSTDAHDLFIDLDPWLRSGMILEEVEALIKPGLSGGAQKMDLGVYRTAMGAAFTTPGDPVDVLLGVVDSADGSNNYQLLTTGAFASLIDLDAYTYVAWVKASDTAGTTSDWLFALRLSFTEPGPRNH